MIKVILTDNSGRSIKIHCLEDTSTEFTLLASKIANFLDLNQERPNVILSGI